MYGCLRIVDTHGNEIDCSTNSSVGRLPVSDNVRLRVRQGCLIPPSELITAVHISDELRFILVIEKEASAVLSLSPELTGTPRPSFEASLHLVIYTIPSSKVVF